MSEVRPRTASKGSKVTHAAQKRSTHRICTTKRNLRNLILEGRLKPSNQLRLPAKMGGKRNKRNKRTLLRLDF